MFQVRDPSIKLFGRDIHSHKPNHFTDSNSFSQIQSLPHPFIMNQLEESINTELNVPFEDLSCKQTDPQDDAHGIPSIQENPTPKPVTEVLHRNNEDRTYKREIDPQEKVLKKPDKVLPCPRCNSFETKFCYFNNYNVNQPRHFCKNCQRYWTDGGTIRNVPVGAGKRKNKLPALQYSQVPVTLDAVSVIQTDSNPVSDMHLIASGLPVSPTHLKGIGNIPSLREEAPLSESLQTVLNLKGKTKIEVDSTTVKYDDLVEEPSSSSMKSSESIEKGYSGNGIEKVGLTQHRNGLVPFHSLHYYPAPPWAYQWNPCWNPIAFTPSSITSRPAYTGSTAMMAVPSFSTSILELPVAPYSCWGGMPNWDGQKEESSLDGSTFSGILSPSSSVNGRTCSGNRSPTLGKHSRDGSIPAEDTTKQNLWVPKTVRINDPEEAAKSSIWSTLRTKSEQNKLIMKGSVFKSFEPKSNAGSCVLDDDQILRANPAALARSESFQESM